MAIPPEDPTQPLPPAGPPRRVRETVLPSEPVVVADDPAWRQLILDRIDSLRTSLVLVGLVALAALVVGLWTLIEQQRDDNRGSGSRVSASEVRDLRERVGELDQKTGDLATKDEVAGLQKSIDQLSKRVDDTAGNAPAAGADNEARASLNDLSDAMTKLNESVADLGRRVEALEQESP